MYNMIITTLTIQYNDKSKLTSKQPDELINSKPNINWQVKTEIHSSRVNNQTQHKIQPLLHNIHIVFN